MSTYTPDRWVVLEFDYEGEKIKKVFAGWAGSYTWGASWKLSSGVTNQRDFDDRIEFDNHSGSLYVCRKGSYGMTGYMSGIFANFEQQVADSEGKVTMRICDEYEH